MATPLNGKLRLGCYRIHFLAPYSSSFIVTMSHLLPRTLLSLCTMMTPFCAMNRVMWLSWMRLLIMNLWDWTVDYKGTNFPWELLKHIPCLLLPSKNIERLNSSLKLWKYQVVRMSFTLFKLPWCSNKFLLGFEGINQEFISYSIHGRRRWIAAPSVEQKSVLFGKIFWKDN